jgi:hypothetical protein
LKCSKDFLTDAPGLVQNYLYSLIVLLISFKTHAILISFFTIAKSKLYGAFLEFNFMNLSQILEQTYFKSHKPDEHLVLGSPQLPFWQLPAEKFNSFLVVELNDENNFLFFIESQEGQ